MARPRAKKPPQARGGAVWREAIGRPWQRQAKAWSGRDGRTRIKRSGDWTSGETAAIGRRGREGTAKGGQGAGGMGGGGSPKKKKGGDVYGGVFGVWGLGGPPAPA